MRFAPLLLSLLIMLVACTPGVAHGQSIGLGMLGSSAHSGSGGGGGIVYNDYYISPSGSDANSGTDAAHPWRNICPNVATLNANIPWKLHDIGTGNLGGSQNYWTSGACNTGSTHEGLQLAYGLTCTSAKPCVIQCDIAAQGCLMDNTFTANNDPSAFGFLIVASSYVTIQGFEMSGPNASAGAFSNYADNVLNDVRQFGFTTNGDTPVGSTTVVLNQNPSSVPSGHYVYIDGSGFAPNTTVSGSCNATTCTLSAPTLVDIPNGSTIYFGPVQDAANHHIAFVNDRFDNSPKGGIGGGARRINGVVQPVDYIDVTGSQCDDNLLGSTQRGSCIDLILLANYDNAPGNHDIIGGWGACVTWNPAITCTGNWVYNNYMCAPGVTSCAAAVSVIDSDGEGIILDSNFTGFGYTGGILVANNIVFYNGSNGIQVFKTEHATVIDNTVWANEQDGYNCSAPAEILFENEPANAGNIGAYNLAFATVNQLVTTADQSTNCTSHGSGAGPNSVYGFMQTSTGAADFLYASDSYNSASTNYRSVTSGITVDASNITAVDPGYTSAPALPVTGPIAASTLYTDLFPTQATLKVNFGGYAVAPNDFIGNARPTSGITIGAVAQ